MTDIFAEDNIAPRCAVWIMLGLIILWLVAAIISLVTGANDYEPVEEPRDYLDGKAAAYTESWFKDHLIWEEQATGFWGALRYSLFHTGSKGVVIGKDGWLFTDEEFDVPANPDELAQQLKTNIGLIDTANTYLATKNSQLLIVIIPSKARIYNDKLPRAVPKMRTDLLQNFTQTLASHNIAFIDGRNVLQMEKDNGRQVFLTYDTHWTPLGAQLMAEEVARYFSNQDYPRLDSHLEPAEPKLVESDLLRFIPLSVLEGVSLPKGDLLPQYTLTQESAGGLFDDVSAPFALVGTSYSYIADWQFADFLKNALQADIVNLAEEGKGPFEPMQTYLADVAKGDNIYPYVIWEIPERFIATDYDVDYSAFNTKGDDK